MKTAIFVDVQNIYYTTRDTFRRSFNYKRFWNQIESKDEIIKANAYAPYVRHMAKLYRCCR